VRLIALMLSLALGGAAHADALPIDQVPMYGGADRAADPVLHAADEKLIADTTAHFGSREKASVAFVNNGMAYYGHDDLVNAMRRFNQAWVLDPANAEVYWGFAVVAHDRGHACDAMKWFDKALSFGHFVVGMDADAARAIVLCVQEDKSLADDAKAALYKRSDDLYAESLAKDPDKGYTYASMASAQYWRGDYAQAWADVKLAEFNDGHLPPKFLTLLGDKLKRPD
jgi:tetratricopeptide (TPR) repeat protein